MKRALKLIGGNLLVLAVLVLALNFISALILDVQAGVKQRFFPSDRRAAYPNYAGQDDAQKIFDEFRALRTDYVPYVGWSRRPIAGETTTVGPDGDRLHAATTDSPVGTVRFFGGSTMWGSGADDEGTIPARFNALFPEYAVYNHGESGFNSRQELARLVNLVNQGEPMDLVVFYDGNNDAGTLCRVDVEMNGHTRAAKIKRLVNPLSWVYDFFTGAIREVLTGKFFKRYVYRTHEGASRCAADPAYAKQVARTMVNNWKLAKAAAEVGGADFVALLQPIASMGNARVDHLPDHEKSPKRDQNLVYRHVREIVAREGLDYVYDFGDAFDGDEYMFIDECHASENGNAAIARRLAPIARPLLEERRGA